MSRLLQRTSVCTENTVREKWLTNVAPWTFIKGCGLDFLEQRVRSGMTIEQEPYFGSEAINDNPKLKTKKQEYMIDRSAERDICFVTTRDDLGLMVKNTCESLGPIVASDPATLVRSSRRGLSRPVRSVEAGTRNTTSRRPPRHTVEKTAWKGE